MPFRCCPKSKVFDVSRDGKGSWIRTSIPSYPKSHENIVCPEDQDNSIWECRDGSFAEYLLDSKIYNFSINGTKLTIKNNCDKKAEVVEIDQLTDNFCVSNFEFW